MKPIYWFSEITKENIKEVGGKGANLGEMTQAGFPVPPGFCVSAQAYFDFIKKTGLKEKIEKILKNLDVRDTKKLQNASTTIKNLILNEKMFLDLAQEIKEAYKKLCQIEGEEVFVAVRSSATAEDLPEASFAGQQASFLNVKGEGELLRAIQACWASLFEARAIFYRQEKGFDHFKVGISVVVQKMVQSEVSGIMFTVEPVENDENKIVIEAGFGLGEAIVSGSVTPDQYLVDKKNFKILEKKINRQDWMIIFKDGRNRHISLPKNKREAQKIEDEKIIEIAKLGAQIESHYQFPQDIEWAFEKGKIYIVQSRPITTLKKQEGKIEEAKGGEIILEGIAASFGVASGPVKIIHSASEIDKIQEGDVLVTEMTNPDFVPAMKKAAAIVTNQGGRTSHAAIVSRELGIPCVVGTGKATQILKDGEIVTVDGKKGVIYKGNILNITSPKPEETGTLPSTFIYEVPVTATKIYVNLAEPDQAEVIAKRPVDGVGLLRAEFMIAQIGEHPKKMIEENRGQEFVAKLAQGLEIFARAFYPRPVVYRATDFKTNEYRSLKGGEKYEPMEENPMIGYRGCFRYIKEPEVFNLELEALKMVRSKGYPNLWLMIPFVRTLEEFEKVKNIIEKSGLLEEKDFKLWIMCEVPSVVILIEKFCQTGIDGISIGSNDLTQLTLGIDRDSSIVAEEFDERNEAVLWSLKRVAETCQKYGVTVSICGQAPSFYPEIVEFLVEAGITSISVNPDAIEETRRIVAAVEKKMILDQIRHNYE